MAYKSIVDENKKSQKNLALEKIGFIKIFNNFFLNISFVSYPTLGISILDKFFSFSLGILPDLTQISIFDCLIQINHPGLSREKFYYDALINLIIPWIFTFIFGLIYLFKRFLTRSRGNTQITLIIISIIFQAFFNCYSNRIKIV